MRVYLGHTWGGLLWMLLLLASSAHAVVDEPELIRRDLFTYNTQGRDLLIDGDIAYVAAGYDGLYILDVADPAQAQVLAHVDNNAFELDGYSLFTVTKDGNSVFCGFRSTVGPFGDGYLKVVDVTNLYTSGPVVGPSDLHLSFGFITPRGRATGSYLDPDTKQLYMALRLAGLGVIDVSDPTDLKMIGRYSPSSSEEYQEVLVIPEHNRAYVGAWVSRLLAVDTSAVAPEDWSHIQFNGLSGSTRNWYMETDGQYLYAPVADSPSDNTFDDGLAVYDLAPNFADAAVSPELVGYAPIPLEQQCESAPGGAEEGQVGSDPGPHQIVLTGDYAVVANGCKGLAIFDISDPMNPIYVKSYEVPLEYDLPYSVIKTSEYPWSIAVKGDFLISVGVSQSGATGNDLVVFRVSPDVDTDGIVDTIDNCPTIANDDQADTDQDGTGDACDIGDLDLDGISDPQDNCLVLANAGQRNTDGDAFGNRCDPDLNNDGVVTVVDYLILRSRLNTNDPHADLNGDGSVTVVDYLILRSFLNQPPGPSGL